MMKQRKGAHDSQTVSAKEYLKLSHGGPSQRQASDTNIDIDRSFISKH